MDIFKVKKPNVLKDRSYLWILGTILLLVLSARLAWKIESNTTCFRENPIFGQGKENTFWDIFLSVLLYLMHQIALCVWWNAIRIRIIQKGVRFFLLCAYGFMFIFALYGCLQLLIFNIDPLWFRISGYFYGVLGVVLPLPGFFAALCLGKPQSFFPKRRFLWVLLPAAILLILMMTNEFHMLFFVKSPNEGVNLQFVPGILFYIMLLWGFVFHSLKIYLVYRVSKEIKTTKLQKALPFLTLFCIFIYLIPYVSGAMIWNNEPFELAYFVFLVEALFWEFCIYLGYVQGNRYHGYVFHNSHIGMEILNIDGDVHLQSTDMKDLSFDEKEQLIKLGKLENGTGYTYYESQFPRGYLVWRIDNRKMYQAIDVLKQNQEELELKLDLVQERFQWEQRERSVRNQKEVFEKLSIVVKDQIIALKRAYTDFKREGMNMDSCFRKMLWISVFLKRYVNIFLLCQGGKTITQDEMRLCFVEFGEKLRWFPGIRTVEVCEGKGNVSQDIALLICKLWILLIEWGEYAPECMELHMKDGRKAKIIIESSTILNKDDFLEWFFSIESPNLNNIDIFEIREGKRQEISVVYKDKGRAEYVCT